MKTQIEERLCAYCCRKFECSRPNQKYCSEKHKQAAENKRWYAKNRQRRIAQIVKRRKTAKGIIFSKPDWNTYWSDYCNCNNLTWETRTEYERIYRKIRRRWSKLYDPGFLSHEKAIRDKNPFKKRSWVRRSRKRYIRQYLEENGHKKDKQVIDKIYALLPNDGLRIRNGDIRLVVE